MFAKGAQVCALHQSDNPSLGREISSESECMQALPPLALLLLEQVGGQPHQEVWVQREGALRHEAAAVGDPGEGAAEAHQGAVRRCAGSSPQVCFCGQPEHSMY